MMARTSDHVCGWAPATALMTGRLLDQPHKHFVGPLIKPGDYPAAQKEPLVRVAHNRRI
jgi:hypothetical protein